MLGLHNDWIKVYNYLLVILPSPSLGWPSYWLLFLVAHYFWGGYTTTKYIPDIWEVELKHALTGPCRVWNGSDCLVSLNSLGESQRDKWTSHITKLRGRHCCRWKFHCDETEHGEQFMKFGGWSAEYLPLRLK